MIRTAAPILISAVIASGCGGTPAKVAASPPAAAAPAPSPASDPAPATTAGEETFTGEITEISFGCAVDASCDLVVDGTKHVHFGHDTRGGPATEWGNTEQLWPLMDRSDQGIGRRIEVFAATPDHQSYTIEGKTAYYIKLLDK